MCHPSTKTMKAATDSASPPPSYSAKDEPESSAVEDVEKTEETTEEGPKMDSGWSWVVLAGAFMVHFTTMGFVASLGIFFNTWMEYFEASAASTSWVISVGSLLRGVLSPVSGALCNRFGPRRVTIVGGMIVVTGIIMSAVTPSITFLVVANGVVTALGVSMAFVSSFQALGMYFKDKFALSAGLASAGVSLGQLVLAPMYTWFNDVFGWRNSLIIAAAISLHIIVAGALMRPNLKRQKKKKEKKKVTADRQNHIEESASEKEKEVMDGIVSQMAMGEEIEQPATDMQSTLVLGEDDYGSGKGFAMIIPEEFPEFEEASPDDFPQLHNSAMDPFMVYVTEEDLDRMSLHESVFFSKPKSPLGALQVTYARVKYFLLDTYGLRRLVHNPSFLVLLVIAFCHGYGELGILYTIPRAESVGVDPEVSSFLVSLIGLGSVIGRVSYGWFIVKGYITPEMGYFWMMVLFSASVAAMSFFSSFLPLAVLAALIGLSAGTASSLVIVIVRLLVQVSDGAGALGLMLLCWGVGEISGTLSGGIIFDLTGNYDLAFYAGGCVLLLASVLALVIHILQKRKQKRALPSAKFFSVLPDPEENTNDEYDFPIVGNVGKRNPMYVSTDDEIMTGDEILQDVDGIQPAADKKKKKRKKYFHRPKFGRKAKAGEMSGIENPMTITHRSVDITDGQDFRVEMEDPEYPSNEDVEYYYTSEEDDGFENPAFVIDESLFVMAVSKEYNVTNADVVDRSDDAISQSSSSDDTLGSTSSFEQVSMERGFENLTFDVAEQEANLSQDGSLDIGINFDLDSGFENPGFDVNPTSFDDDPAEPTDFLCRTPDDVDSCDGMTTASPDLASHASHSQQDED